MGYPLGFLKVAHLVPTCGLQAAALESGHLYPQILLTCKLMRHILALGCEEQRGKF